MCFSQQLIALFVTLTRDLCSLFRSKSPKSTRLLFLFLYVLLSYFITSTVLVDSGHKLFPLFYRKRGMFEKIVHSNTVNWSLGSNRELLRAMMMTACDVAAITKPWEIQHKVCNMYC